MVSTGNICGLLPWTTLLSDWAGRGCALRRLCFLHSHTTLAGLLMSHDAFLLLSEVCCIFKPLARRNVSVVHSAVDVDIGVEFLLLFASGAEALLAM